MKNLWQMSWSSGNEQAIRLWVRQIVSLAFLYMRAARWSRRISFTTTFIAAFGTLFTIPGYGCGLVTGEVCAALQWSGIVVGMLVGLNNVLDAIYSPGGRVERYERASKDLLKISRRIDAELAKPPPTRQESALFRSAIVGDYDAIVDHVRLPWFIHGEQQLANMSLLQSYSEETAPVVGVTHVDRSVMCEIQHELDRLARFSPHDE